MKFLRGSLFSLILLSLIGVNNSTAQLQDTLSLPIAIEDNSFFIEEAYNQEPRVIQHVFTSRYVRTPHRDMEFSFTQEWPIVYQDHQLSFTFLYHSVNANELQGIGDSYINYRYQLYTKDDWAAVSPRSSLILPTGSKSKGLSYGGIGYELNLPVSKQISSNFVAISISVFPYLEASKREGRNIRSLHTLPVEA